MHRSGPPLVEPLEPAPVPSVALAIIVPPVVPASVVDSPPVADAEPSLAVPVAEAVLADVVGAPLLPSELLPVAVTEPSLADAVPVVAPVPSSPQPAANAGTRPKRPNFK